MNDEIRMTNDKEGRHRSREYGTLRLPFVIRASSFVMDSSFGFRHSPFLCGLPALALLLFFFVIPLIALAHATLRGSATASGATTGFAHIEQLLADRLLWELLGFTFALAAALTVICLSLGYALALFLWGLKGRWKVAAVFALLVPKLSNILITAYGLKLLLGEAGPVNRALIFSGLVGAPLPLVHNRIGVLISETCFILPYTALILWITLERLDVELLSAAQGLGASPWHIFRRVTFPLSRPGLVVAATITLVWGLGAYVGPVLFGSPQEITLAVDIQRQAFENQDWPRAAFEALLLLATLGAIVVLWEARRPPLEAPQ